MVCVLPSGFPIKTLFASCSLHTYNMPSPSHPLSFDHPYNIACGVEIIKLLTVQFSPVPCYSIPLLAPNTFLSTLFSNTLPRLNQLSRDTKHQASFWFCIFESSYIWRANWKTKDSGLNSSRTSPSSVSS